jgi:hypothetical protein
MSGKNSCFATPCVAVLSVLLAGAGVATAAGPRAGEDPKVIVLPDVVGTELPRALARLGRLPRLSPGGWFGFGLTSNASISDRDSNGVSRWRFHNVPSIYSVDPESPAAKGGLEPGDRMLKIDGMEITTPEAGRRFGAVKPGDKVRWTVEHEGKTRVVTLVAEEHPDRDEFDSDAQARVREALDKLRMQNDHLRAQTDQMRGEHLSESYARAMELAQRELEMTQRQLERTVEQMQRRAETLPKSGPNTRVYAIPTDDDIDQKRHLRYKGDIGDSEVEVRGSGSVVVSEEPGGGAVLIATPDATIRVEKKKKK